MRTFDQEELIALETAPLSADVDDSYRCGHAVVPNEHNIVTPVEVPDDTPQKYSSYIFPPSTSADQR